MYFCSLHSYNTLFVSLCQIASMDSQRISVLQAIIGSHTRAPQEDHGLGKDIHYNENLESSQWHSNSPKTRLMAPSRSHHTRSKPLLLHFCHCIIMLFMHLSPLDNEFPKGKIHMSLTHRRVQCLLVRWLNFTLKKTNASEHGSLWNFANTF